jgi:hypothetical protein
MGHLLWWVRDGCGHGKTSFPITRSESEINEKEGPVVKTYVVCLNCGKELPYSWDQMRVLRQ